MKLPPRAEDLRARTQNAVRDANYMVSEDVFEAATALHEAVPDEDWIAASTPDFGKDEWLAVVDEQGHAIATDVEFGTPAWLKCIDGYWMAQRWAAHAVGFRHRVVHLFLVPEHMTNGVMIQLRSFDKANAPGCFDVTLGGHVAAGHEPDETLAVELLEELNLTADRDLDDLEFCGAYDFHGTVDDGEWANTEYRYVYRAALKTEAAGHMAYADGEVAGMLTLTQDAARQLMAEAPDRIASGLRESYTYFTQR